MFAGMEDRHFPVLTVTELWVMMNSSSIAQFFYGKFMTVHSSRGENER
jgi:hypothetical protein